MQPQSYAVNSEEDKQMKNRMINKITSYIQSIRHRSNADYSWFLLISITFIISSCTVERFINDDELFLKEAIVKSSDTKITKPYNLQDYIIQSPNSKWFGFKVPLQIYCISGTDTTKKTNKFFQKLGEDPVIYDSLKAQRTISDITQVLWNEGYMHAKVNEEKDIKGKKLLLTYKVDPGKRFWIKSVKRFSADDNIAQLICNSDTNQSLLKQGMPFNINYLNEERSRITTMLRNQGFYKFNKDNIRFIADTIKGSNMVDLTMSVSLHQENGRTEPVNHPVYRIGNINYFIDTQGITDTTALHKLVCNDKTIYYPNTLKFRPSLLTSNTLFSKGKLFNEDEQKKTYHYFTRLDAIASSNIKLQENDNNILDCNILLSRAQSQSISFDIEGTNSAGDLGVAASTSYRHKNIFHGSETFTLKVRGAYEAITGLEGYDGHNYIEFGSEMNLGFPGFLLPYINKEFGAIHSATSEIAIQYNMQKRPEFNRRVFTAAWRYRWNSLNTKATHRFDLLEVNYVYMPWMSKTFKEQYLDSLGKTNAILKYNYENQLITKLGYTYSYNSLGSHVTSTYGKNAYTIKFNIETSGNLLNTISNLIDSSDRNANGQHTFCNIAYAQYAKGDFDIAKSIRIDKNNSVALHTSLGIACPYGNSMILPFEKRYFAGGANSVRGWSVRSLGPGKYNGADKGINFINQSGDIKLDMSIEYRAFLFWKFNGALFIDGGNIWTIRDYKDQPGGVFRFNEFYKQIAFAYGIGLRMNLDFFIIRFDAGMKAINPAYTGKRHYPIAHPNFNRDFSLHFAIGLPF